MTTRVFLDGIEGAIDDGGAIRIGGLVGTLDGDLTDGTIRLGGLVGTISGGAVRYGSMVGAVIDDVLYLDGLRGDGGSTPVPPPITAPTFVSSGATQTWNDGDNAKSIAVPTSFQAGDLLVVLAGAAAQGVSFQAPTGFTQIAGYNTPIGYLFGKIADGTETDISWRPRAAGDFLCVAKMMAFRGMPGTLTGISDTSSASAGAVQATYSQPGLTIANDNEVAFLITGMGFLFGLTNYAPASYPGFTVVAVADVISTGLVTGRVGLAYSIQSAKANVPANSWTASGTQPGSAAAYSSSFAIKSAFS